MDPLEARWTLNDRLSTLASARRRAERDLEDYALQIGATTTYLRDVLGQSKAQSAEHVGISPSHLTQYMARAAEAGTVIDDPLQRIARASEVDPLRVFLRDHGGLARIIASFAESDTLYMSGVHPARLLVASPATGPHLALAALMLQAEDGEWFAVDRCSVGYGGVGPRLVQSILAGIGLEEDLTLQIAGSRVSDVRFDGLHVTSADHSDSWPRYPVAAPRVHATRFIVPLPYSDLLDIAPARDSVRGFFPSASGRTAYDSWLELLDGRAPRPRPDWLSGARRGRLYLDPEAAHADGYVAPTTFGDFIPSFILSQGDVELWIETPYVSEGRKLLDPSMYPLLRQARFEVDHLEARDNAGAFRRLLSGSGPRESHIELRVQ